MYSTNSMSYYQRKRSSRLNSLCSSLEALLFDMWDEWGQLLRCIYLLKTSEDSLPRLPPVLAHSDNLWHKVGATKKTPFPLWHGALVAGTVASQQEGRGFVFCVEPAWMFAWIYSKDQQARRIGGSKLANGVNLSQSVFLWTLSQTDSFGTVFLLSTKNVRWDTLEPLVTPKMSTCVKTINEYILNHTVIAPGRLI